VHGIAFLTAIVHSKGFLRTRSVGEAAFVIAFFSMVIRVGVKIEGAIASGNPPKTLTYKGLRPAKSKKWWFLTWFIKSPEGWRNLERLLLVVAIVAALVAVGCIVIIRAVGLH
jgi:hypothetical protein